MTNLDKAAEAIRSRYPSFDAISANGIAQALANAGLLMPDLPEPQAIGAGEYQYTDDRGDESGHVSAWEPGVIGITLPHGSGHQIVTVGEALHLVAGLMKLIAQDTRLTEAEKEQGNG